MPDLLEKIKNTVYCRLKPSNIEGVGVFAIRAIPKGIDPFVGCEIYGHKLVHKSRIKKLPRNLAKYIVDMCVCENDHYTVPNAGLNALDISFYINHSKTPNMETSDGCYFITLRAIKEGEELTIDYGTYNDEDLKF